MQIPQLVKIDEVRNKSNSMETKKKRVNQKANSKKKKPDQTSQAPKPSSNYIDQTQFDNFYQRMVLLEQQKLSKVEKLRMRKEHEEESNLREKPEITQKSRFIMKRKSKAERLPIDRRLGDIIKAKNDRLNRLKQADAERKRIEEEEEYKPTIPLRRRDRSKSRDSDSPNFFERLELYDRKKRINRKRLEYKKLSQDLKEVRVKPVISEESRFLAVQKRGLLTIEERLYNDVRERQERYEREYKQYMSKMCPFKPKINRSIPQKTTEESTYQIEITPVKDYKGNSLGRSASQRTKKKEMDEYPISAQEVTTFLDNLRKSEAQKACTLKGSKKQTRIQNSKIRTIRPKKQVDCSDDESYYELEYDADKMSFILEALKDIK